MAENQNHNVTAVIPCFNDGLYIEESLRSLLEQSLPLSQIIIIDDGSDQATIEILKRIENPLVEIIYQQNSGVCVARNVGISKAKTPYILTLDADDRFETTFVQKAIKILSDKSSVGAVCCYYREFGSGNLNKDIIIPSGGTVTDFLVKNNGVGNALFRKACWEEVQGYDEHFNKGYEDWDFWLGILSKGWVMEVLKEPLFWYRKKERSRDTTALATYDYELRSKLFEKHKEVYEKNFESFASQLLWRNSQLRKEVAKTESSVDYRLGSRILAPLRRIKKLFS